ncbi:hypothetical protein D0Z03_002843 [Geotrichum reessii]|nr:hypothetical protein D0Z03_002843 [Galactomyces reessii]
MSSTDLLSKADFSQTPRYFKKPSWRTPSRRHKPARTVLADEQRRIAAIEATLESPANFNSYQSLDAPPSLRPRKWWCDITGLEGKYKSVRNSLRYHNVEIYNVIQNLSSGVDQQYLELRNANVVLK